MAGKRILITAEEVSMEADLRDCNTAEKIWDALPIVGDGSTWGDEIYFSIPVKCDSEDPQPVVQLGDLGYWPPGTAFCIFFGPTPMSQGDEIRPASAVNVFGKLNGDPKEFKKVGAGATVRIERVEG